MRKLILATAALTAVSLFSFGRTLLVGHRGCDTGVENTVEAFRNGAARGYDFLECDVRVTADSQLVICHDTDTRRLGGNLEIATATLAQLKADTLRQERKTGTYTGVICTLGEYLDICRQAAVRPVIELKWSTGINSQDFGCIPMLIDSIEAHGQRQSCVILTSMRPCLDYIKANWPDIELQFLGNREWDQHLPWCIANGFDVDIAHDKLTRELIDSCHQAGLLVNCWTVDDPDRAATLIDMGVDIITTNSLPKRP